MKTKNIILLTILTLGGFMMSQPAFSTLRPGRPLPMPAIRSSPVPRSTATPTPAPVPPAVASLVISYGTSASSNVAITVNVGQAGAPAGFSIQWMTLADYTALGNRWPATYEVPNPQAPSFCRATFGVPVTPGCAGYSLHPWQSVTVTIGDDSLHDNCAVSSPCSDSPLLCNTAYVLRAFALDSTGQLRVSNTVTCATVPCVRGTSCTYTQGYWRNHPDAWPVTSLTIGTVTYQAAELMAILDNPARDNGLVILAHQLVAAKLNIANGADPSAVQQTVTDADAIIATLVIPPIGNGYMPPGQTGNLIETLTQYNEGTIGPGHCND